MSSTVDSSPVVLRQFTIRPLKLANQQSTNQSVLKLQFSTGDAEVQKAMSASIESEDVFWTAKGGVKVSSTTQQLQLSVLNEDKGVVTELCNATVAYTDVAKHAREHSKDAYEILLDNATASTLLLVTCTTTIPLSGDTATARQSPIPVLSPPFGRTDSDLSLQTATLSYPSSNSLVPSMSDRANLERLELERLYERTKKNPKESRAYDLNAIGHDYHGLVQEVHDPDDTIILARAISILDEAVQCSSTLDPHRAEYITDFSNALITRFKRTGDLAALNDAITASRDAISITKDEDSYKSQTLKIYAMAVDMRYKRLGNIEDLQLAVSLYEKEIEFASNPNTIVRILNDLATVLMVRFEQLRDLQDLEAAILHLQKGIELMPDEYPNRSWIINSLGTAFGMRFERLGHLDDLEVAIRHAEMAIKLTPDGHLHKPGILSNLGIAFETRFLRLGHVNDLKEAVRHKQMAVDLAPDEHRDKYKLLENLANTLDILFLYSKRPEVIEASLSHRRRAVNLWPKEHADAPSCLIGLATTLLRRFRYLDNLENLEEAIINYQKALDLLPETHSDKLTAFINQGMALYNRYERLKQIDDLRRACDCSSTVANFLSAAPTDRLEQARRWAQRLRELESPPLPAFQVAIEMLPRVAWLGLPLPGQHTLLKEVGEVVRDAVEAAIEREEYEMAVEWAEAGRSIAWQNHLKLRTPVDELREVHPQLARDLESISYRLERSFRRDASDTSMPSLEDTSRSHIQLGMDWDNTLKEIRGKEGFESFLKNKTFNQLAPAARPG